jgi:hypothetical protein
VQSGQYFTSIKKESVLLVIGIRDSLSSFSIVNEKKNEGTGGAMEDQRKRRKLKEKGEEK